MSSAFRIDVLCIWRDLFRELIGKSPHLLRALLLPAILMAMCEWISTEIGGVGGFIFGILYWAFTAMFAVSIHRIVLLSPDSLTNPWGVYLDRYVLRYMLYLLLIAFLFTFMTLGLALVIMPAGAVASTITPFLLLAALWVLMLYWMARIHLVLPAQAVGDPLGIVEVLQMTKGNGWRLVVATFVPILVISILLWPLTLLTERLPAEFSPLPMVLNILLGGLVGIAVLSCAYRQFEPASGETGAIPDAPE